MQHIKTYTLGIQGMVEVPNGAGKYVETSYHVAEMQAWEHLNQKNKLFAENLLRVSDDDIAKKNVRIRALMAEVDALKITMKMKEG